MNFIQKTWRTSFKEAETKLSFVFWSGSCRIICLRKSLRDRGRDELNMIILLDSIVMISIYSYSWLHSSLEQIKGYIFMLLFQGFHQLILLYSPLAIDGWVTIFVRSRCSEEVPSLAIHLMSSENIGSPSSNYKLSDDSEDPPIGVIRVPESAMGLLSTYDDFYICK